MPSAYACHLVFIAALRQFRHLVTITELRNYRHLVITYTLKEQKFWGGGGARPPWSPGYATGEVNLVNVTSHWENRSKVSAISFRSVGRPTTIKSDILMKLHVLGGLNGPWLSIVVILCMYTITNTDTKVLRRCSLFILTSRLNRTLSNPAMICHFYASRWFGVLN